MTDPATYPTATRRRAMGALFVSVAATAVTTSGTSTVGTLIAADAVGSAWSGISATFGIAGNACGALLLSRLMAAKGRRFGLQVGFSSAVAGALLAVTGVLADVFPLLLFGMVLLGVGNGGAQLARYAGAEFYPPERRATALSALVWAGTVGAILGPSLIAPAAAGAREAGLPELAGTFILAVFVCALACGSATLLPSGAGRAPTAATPGEGMRSWLSIRPVRLALAAMVCGQVSMVAVMTMTPVHLHSHGQGLATVGGVLAAHMIGMFALSPLSGRLADRYGGTTAIVAGIGTLVCSSVVAILAPADASGPLLPVALFLLGYGWNLCFVGGSSLLSRDLPAAQRTRLQGGIDAAVWAASAVASLVSGRLLAVGDYGFLAAIAGLIAIAPVVFMIGRTQRRSFEETKAERM
jgi:MFS family permease